MSNKDGMISNDDIDRIQLILPLTIECDQEGLGGRCNFGLNKLQYTADHVSLLTDCQIDVIFPGPENINYWFEGKESRRAAFSIFGSKSNVLRARSQLALVRRGHIHTVRYEAAHSPEALNIAKLTLGEEFPATPLTPPESDEEIEGEASEMETFRMLNIQKLDRLTGMKTESFDIPTGAAGMILGLSGRRKVQTFLTSGVLVEVIGRVKESGRTCKVYLTCNDADKIQIVKENILKSIDPIKYSRDAVLLNERIIDWLLTFRPQKLQEIAHKTGCSLLLEDGLLNVESTKQSNIKKAIKDIIALTYDLHTVSLWLHGGRDECERLQRIGQIGEAEIAISFDIKDRFEIKLYGTKTQMENTMLLIEQEHIPILQVSYILPQSEEIREFVSGKKDGKLIKIMKETGVSIALHPSEILPKEANIDIELMGRDRQSVVSAIDMLTGEFPAEVTFHLPEEHHKRLIGHGGKNIQRVMKKHAVYVKFFGIDEAKESSEDENKTPSPKSPENRLDNVIIRTPAKNSDALEAAKGEILELAEEKLISKSQITLKFSRKSLLGASKDQRKTLLDLFGKYSESLDYTECIPEKQHDRQGEDNLECCIFQIAGYEAALDNLKSNFNDPEIQSLLNVLTSHPSSKIASSVASPNMTPNLLLSEGISDKVSWTSQSPELFRHFNNAVLHIAKPRTTPILSPRNEPLTTGFNPTIGSQLKKPGPWSMGFPKIIEEGSDEKEEIFSLINWKAISAEHYRRQVNSLFSS